MTSSRNLLALVLSCSPSTQDASFGDIHGLRAASETAPAALEEQDQVLSLIAADRRQFEPVEPGVFAARIGGRLGAELSTTGLLATTDRDTIGLATVAYGGREIGASEPGEGDCAPGAEIIGTACVRQVELDHGPLTEWWVSRADGLEHGWTLYEAPSAGPVAITVRLTEGQLLSVDDDGQGARLAGSTGGRWRYDTLLAWDATGALVPAWMEAEGGDLVVRVDTRAVQWPVMVDPLLTSEDKLTASDGAHDDLFGSSVARAGDVDGDGYDDLVIGAYADDDNGSNSGSAYVYYGSSAGIDTRTEDKLTASDGGSLDWFGRSVAGAGDVNGDGFDDLVVGAFRDNDNGWASGSAYVYYGSSAGIDTSTEDKLTASDSAAGDHFGTSVAGAGDVDGDGYDDIVIGAYADDDNGSNSGSAYVYYGSSAGIDTSTEDKLIASDGGASDYYGSRVAGAGDLDGDGYDDLVIGAYEDNDMGWYSGSAYVYYGSSAGIDTSTEDKLTASDGADYDRFGRSVAGAGDVNGDGYDDLVIGAYGDDDNGWYAGSAYVYYGSSAGIDTSTEDKLTASDGALEHYFGLSVAGAGDVDGDGYDDLVIGAYGSDDNGWESGSAYVYYGSSAGIDTRTEDKLTASDGAVGDRFGLRVAGAGDVDGDGYDDLVIGADEDNDNGWDSGSAYVYYGDCPDEDEDGYCATSDCDDEDSSVGRASTWHADTDSDGYGDPSRTTTACAPPSGYTSVDHDCDDTDAAIHPGATEGVGDEVDSDCDGTETCYADKDDDGYTDTTATVDSVDTDCADSGEGSSSDPDQDCDDRDSSFHPGAAEDDCTDPNDYNCDGSVAFADADADGWAACEECDDSDAGVNPDAEEILDDGIDQDCDGVDEVTPAGGDDGGSDDGGSDDGGSDATGKEACGCSSNPAPGRGAGMLIGLLALVGLRRRKPRAVDEGGEASVA